MRGLVLVGPGDVRHRTDLPAPQIADPTDAVVAVRRAGLCGSDLHPYEGREAARPGVVPGHEVVGDVVAVGAAVREVAVGDRVLVPFTTSCGGCPACERGLSARCARGQLLGHAAPVGIADADVADVADAPWADLAPGEGLHGGQAEAVRIPLADSTLVPVPQELGDLDALLLADVLPTGWHAVARADVASGATLVVVGLGAVGLCAVVAARTLGADPVVAVDPVADRRERAMALGATAVTPEEAPTAVPAGAGAVVEAAGSVSGQALAFGLLRAGGTLSAIAVQTADRFAFTPVDAYDRNATVRVGRAPVRSLLDTLLPEVVAGRLRVPTEVVVTHPGVPLAEGPAVYRRFAAREPGMVKVAFAP